METLPAARAIRAMHPHDLAPARDKLTRFLCGWLGGPHLYRERYGSINLPQAHAHLGVAGAERDAWLQCMRKAVDRQPFSERFREYLMTQLAVPAERVRQVCARRP